MTESHRSRLFLTRRGLCSLCTEGSLSARIPANPIFWIARRTDGEREAQVPDRGQFPWLRLVSGPGSHAPLPRPRIPRSLAQVSALSRQRSIRPLDHLVLLPRTRGRNQAQIPNDRELADVHGAPRPTVDPAVPGPGVPGSSVQVRETWRAVDCFTSFSLPRQSP